MADTITIRTSTERDVIKIVERGPQGPAGTAGTGLDTLTVRGDTLYRGETTGERLPIGSAGQILKVSSSGLPEWGAAPATGVTSVALASSDLTITGSPITASGTITANLANSGATAGTYTKVTVDAKGRVTAGATATASDVGAAATTHASEHEAGEADEIQAMAALVITVGGTNVDGVYFHDGTLTSGRPNFFRVGTRKNTKLQWNNARSKWELYRNLTLEAEEAAAGTSAKPWDAAEWEDQRTPPVISSINVTRLGLEDMTQKLAETGAPATATTSEDGLMSAADKTKLNGIASGATANTASSATPSTLGTAAAGSSSDYSRADHVHSAEVSDSAFRVIGSTDATKKVALEVDTNVPTGTTVTITSPASSGTLALTTTVVDNAAGLWDAANSVTGLTVSDYELSVTNGADTSSLTFSPGASKNYTLPNASGTLMLNNIGSTSGLPLVTTTAGAITTLALGSAGQVLKVNSGGTAVEFGAAASGGTKTYAVFSAEHNQPPSSAFATLDTRNSIAVLDFDDATDESAVFVSVMPEGASLGSGLKIRLHWMATSATSGNCVWDVSLERMTTDLDSDSFDTIASATAAANGTSGILTVTEITLTTIDSVTAGDGFRLKVTRDANNASDTMSGDAELVAVEVRSAA